MRAIFYIAWKDLVLVTRDRVALFWVIGFPVLFALLLGTVLDGAMERDARAVRVVVVDAGAPADAIAEGLARTRALDVQRAPRAAAERAVLRGDAVALVDVHARPGRPPRIELDADPTHRLDAAIVRSVLIEALREPSPNAPEVTTSFALEGPKQSGYELVLPAAILWALMGCAATFAVAMVSERATGTLLRLRAAPVHPTALLAGKALAAFLACSFAAAVLLGLGRAVVGVRIVSPGALAAAVAAVATCFVGLTIAIGALGRSVQAVTGAGWATLIVLAMLGGAMVPLSAMPAWIAPVSELSPVRWGIAALEGATFRGATALDLARSCVALVATGIAAFGLGVGALAWGER